MKVETVVVGSLDENCYILKKENTCLVVDPGDDYQKIKEAIGECKVLAVLITHSHFDHIGALREFLKKRSIKIFKKSNVLEQHYQIGNFSFQVLQTPGHSSDSISFYFEEEKKMFVGDFVFYEDIGRCDLPTGNFTQMEESIKKLKQYPDEITLYPGHGVPTTLEHEKKMNSYFK